MKFITNIKSVAGIAMDTAKWIFLRGARYAETNAAKKGEICIKINNAPENMAA